MDARPASRGAWAETTLNASSSLPVDDALTTRVAPRHTTDLCAGWERIIRGVQVSPFVGINNPFDRRYLGSMVINAARGRC